ncbi:MAG TPA: phosphodiester glycosidase family protein [Gaiellaceae bacterium]|nr:phosphodiester glycosidase family protein [Gaiellaceae bacterium]
MSKRGLLPVALVATLLAAPATAGAAATLMPGVSYEREKRLIGGRAVVLHIVRTPPDGGLYQLRPVLSGNTVLGRQSVPSMQRSLSRRATTVGVNGDFFDMATGRPSGVHMRDGVLKARPNAHRSALAIRFDGTLLVDRFRLRGTWQAGANPNRRLHQLNRTLDGGGVALYTRDWGGRTQKGRGAVEVVLRPFPRTVLNGLLTGTVAKVRRDGDRRIPRGAAVLQARGDWRQTLLREAVRGSQVTVQLRMPGFPDDAADAVGGGPVLVRDGVPVRQADEWFTLDQLNARHPRTAVGQLGNGRLVFVVADGRSRRSRGVTQWQMAQTMAGLGARTAMGLDGGGSSTIAVDGKVLNEPSDGVPRAVSSGLFVYYYGVYAPPPSRGVITPNGDGVSDTLVARAKVVRPSVVRLRLLRPDGSVAWRQRRSVGRGWISRTVGARSMANGRWRWVAVATESVSGRRSRTTRAFAVNKTLGFLRLDRERMRVRRGAGGRLSVSVRVAVRANLTVRVRSAAGTTRRVLHRGETGPGSHSWVWNGRGKTGGLVGSGVYTIDVRAVNGLGAVTLRDTVRVVRRS